MKHDKRKEMIQRCKSNLIEQNHLLEEKTAKIESQKKSIEILGGDTQEATLSVEQLSKEAEIKVSKQPLHLSPLTPSPTQALKASLESQEAKTEQQRELLNHHRDKNESLSKELESRASLKHADVREV